ncbi:MAG: urease accessory protein UreD [Pseudorhodoplanes sp.]|jgi:urease accessory protein|nr:urease accessory protein UreD [Pseudorhodoplanes sp.]
MQESDETFAANRARGRIALGVAAVDGRTRRSQVGEEGSLRVRFPNTTAAECEAVIVNTAGGIAGGDRFALEVNAGTGAELVVTGAAAEKVYRAIDADAEMAVSLSVAAGAALRWLPQETILFDRARLHRSIDVELADDASLLLAEAVVFGRSAMGESVNQGRLIDRWRVRRGGRLIFAETLRLDGDIADTLAEPSVAKGSAAIATVLLVPGSDDAIAKVRALGEQFAGEVGISVWNGIAVARLCARDGAALRRDLIAMLAALDRKTLPRLWLN